MAAQNDSFAGYPTFIRGYDLVVIRSCPKKVHVSPTWPSHVLVGLKPLFTVQKDESIECRASKKLRARNVDVLWGVKHGPKVFYDHFPTFWKGSANGNTAKSRDTPRPQLMLMVWSSCAKEMATLMENILWQSMAKLWELHKPKLLTLTETVQSFPWTNSANWGEERLKAEAQASLPRTHPM